MSNIATKIKEFRQQSGLSRQAVADILGLTSVAVGMWERGICYPSSTNARRVETLMEAWLGNNKTEINESQTEPVQIPIKSKLDELLDRRSDLLDALNQVEELIDAYNAGVSDARSRAQGLKTENPLTV